MFKLARKEEGFTLIELLVVVAIIALLTAFAVPRLFDAINKSKGSRGQADLETVSGALERFYMDKSSYPTDPASATTGLKGEYLKAGTNYLNGYNRQYIYLGGAGFYILVDPKNQPDDRSLTITCGTNTPAHTATAAVSEITNTGSYTPAVVLATQSANPITKDDVKAGNCTISGHDTAADTPVIVTN